MGCGSIKFQKKKTHNRYGKELGHCLEIYCLAFNCHGYWINCLVSKMKIITFLIFFLFTSIVYSVDVVPYETEKITIEQWNEYHDLVSKELAITGRAYESHKLEVFSDDQVRASIAFTMPGHKAHPSWVTRHVESKDGSIYMKVIGYFAGDEKAFKILFGQYQEMANQTRKQFQR